MKANGYGMLTLPIGFDAEVQTVNEMNRRATDCVRLIHGQ